MNYTSDLETKIHEPIFVFGCSNSGTTVLWKALKQHRDISGPPVEGQDLVGMPNPMTHFLGQHTFRMWAHYLHEQPASKWNEDHLPGSKLPYYFTERDWNERYQRQIVEVYSKFLQKETRLCDKSPAHTLRARFLQRCFPDAKFIAIVRNGYAVCEGIIRKRDLDPERPQFRGLYTEINDAAWQWEKANEVIASYESHKLLSNYIIIKYEELVTDTIATFTKLLNFCNLDSNSFDIPTFEHKYNSDQISRLTSRDFDVISRIAAPMLVRFGYAMI